MSGLLTPLARLVMPAPRVVHREVEPPREHLPTRHHPNLDATAIKVRATHMPGLAGRCYCCEVKVDSGYLCTGCQDRGCAA